MKKIILAATLGLAAPAMASAKPQCLGLVELLAMQTKYDAQIAERVDDFPAARLDTRQAAKDAETLAGVANSALIECSVELKGRQ